MTKKHHWLVLLCLILLSTLIFYGCSAKSSHVLKGGYIFANNNMVYYVRPCVEGMGNNCSAALLLYDNKGGYVAKIVFDASDKGEKLFAEFLNMDTPRKKEYIIKVFNEHHNIDLGYSQ